MSKECFLLCLLLYIKCVFCSFVSVKNEKQRNRFKWNFYWSGRVENVGLENRQYHTSFLSRCHSITFLNSLKKLLSRLVTLFSVVIRLGSNIQHFKCSNTSRSGFSGKFILFPERFVTNLMQVLVDKERVCGNLEFSNQVNSPVVTPKST